MTSGQGGPDDTVLTIDKRNIPVYVSAALYRYVPDAFNALVKQRQMDAQNQALGRVSDEALALRRQGGGGLQIVPGASQAPAGGGTESAPWSESSNEWAVLAVTGALRLPLRSPPHLEVQRSARQRLTRPLAMALFRETLRQPADRSRPGPVP